MQKAQKMTVRRAARGAKLDKMDRVKATSGFSARALVLLLAVPALFACSASPSPGEPTTGPLYFAGATVHTCTASVVASPGHDLLITAAHCVWGSGVGMTFVPDSVNGSAPYSRWTVTAAYVDPAWKSRQDPLRDVAFLRVAPQRLNGATRHVQDLTGANTLITTPATIGLVAVPAYPLGVGGSPITCTAKAYRSGSYPAFDCSGYGAGVSGAPWIQGTSVLGVIGGLHQGGCSPNTSYSAPFDTTTLATYRRAVAGGPADVLPVAGSDGC